MLSSVGQAFGAVSNSGRPVMEATRDLNGPMPISRAKAFLRAMPNKWRGVPYRFGGTTRRGIDCSAFVQAVYREVFNYELPRSTFGQAEVGERISRSELKPGDLIIFYSKYSGSRRHVGIYVGDNEFLHISSSRDRVVIDDLNRYDNAPGLSYLQARRVVKLDEDASTMEELFEPKVEEVPALTQKVMQRVILAGTLAF